MLILAALALFAQEAPAVDPSQDTAWMNRQMLALASLKGGEGWHSAEGGLRWRRVKGDGAGTHPSATDQVTIHYAGSFIDGTEFDSSYGRGPATFPLDRLIRAWQIAVPLMGVGDTIEIAVPSDLGYGPRGKGPIPGGATLLFKIELLGIGG
ncbi:FKBP-type peptidyl-prolyl cis-trans isomerase [Sphingomonas hengshuiensis]|uniref:Peptidyl-prolyl cis-trans isomerase n=1 Tax=Sphingomonas hengshuiensis TaxID=1609977 RepID=A0A7U5BG36_9SPHN|nr:FKBP-type peptidyl-prolyl cis-trans isomerase [Sphingomonas hengshuiensis]AJP74607.1 peptidylprolyl isomerase [Sphingomonas hengshuiensis]